MTSELLSTARPSRLRFVGFLAIVVGAGAIGLAATRRWVTIGFAGDTEGAADVPLNGTDLWEGKAVLLAAAVALTLMLVIRIARSSTTRRVLAIGLIVIGLASAALVTIVALGAEDRFAGDEGIDRIAAAISRQTGDSEEVVREALLETLRGLLRVDVAITTWIVVGGGLVLAGGGALTLAWIRERGRLDASGVEEPEPPLA
ncbi:MAG TPA: hypothetical protein VEC15_06010 [Actinomycetota bacterium]|nr:hypothetical protein [Actinomycetota bacterium]